MAIGLGCKPEEVTAEFYKLLIYDTGGFFLAHRDSEKAGGMFGTLVVALPSGHEGGELLVRHAGREAKFGLTGTDPGEVQFAGFYADCEHEVAPITSGYRVCLIFNLIHRAEPDMPLPPTPDDRSAICRAAVILRKWTDTETPEKLVYLLDHHYTPAGLSFASLKNADAARAAVLRAAAREAGCDLHLAMVHIEDSGAAEYGGGSYCRGRRYREDEWEADYSVGEICESRQYLGDFRTTEDVPVSFGEMPLGDDELLPAGALDDEEPDEVHFSEATGNAGAEFERTYLRAALVLWPSSRANQVFLSTGIAAGVARLSILVNHSEQSSSTNREAWQAQAAQLANLIIERWDSTTTSPVALTLFLGHLVKLEDPALIVRALSHPALVSYNGSQNSALADALHFIPSATAATFLKEFFNAHGPELAAACIDLWVRLATDSEMQSAVLQPALATNPAT